MEKNQYNDQILGVVATEDIVEGRMVLLTSHTWDNDYGSLTDLPGVKLPDNTTEAARARYILTWADDNRPTPLYNTYPSFSFALRYGFDQAANAPFSATVFLTHPAQQEGVTIPSGTAALAYGDGIYTVPSGGYVYNAAFLTPGSPLSVADTASDGASDAGKIKYDASGTIAEVFKFDTATGKLSFRILK